MGNPIQHVTFKIGLGHVTNPMDWWSLPRICKLIFLLIQYHPTDTGAHFLAYVHLSQPHSCCKSLQTALFAILVASLKR